MSSREHHGEERPALDARAYPIDHLAEVVPGLAIADDTVGPDELFAQGFDAVYDVYGPGLHPPASTGYVVHRIDDLPWAIVPDTVDVVAEEVADLLRQDRRVVITCST